MSKKFEEEVTNHPLIKEIISHLNLNENQIKSGINIFRNIVEEQEQIDSLDFITKVKIYDENNVIAVSAPNGKFKEQLLRKKYHILSEISWINPNLKFDKNIKTNIKSIDDNLFFWSLDEDKENNRIEIAEWFKYFFKTNILEKKSVKGCFIHGPFGVGKTTFLIAFCNYLIEHKKTVAFLRLGEFNEYLKTNLAFPENFSYIMKKIKNVDYLLIDDIGSEKASEWSLFSILYQIVEYRLIKNKFCAFSSNFDYKELERIYCNIPNIDQNKVHRLIDRIESLTKLVEMDGKNIKKII